MIDMIRYIHHEEESEKLSLLLITNLFTEHMRCAIAQDFWNEGASSHVKLSWPFSMHPHPIVNFLVPNAQKLH